MFAGWITFSAFERGRRDGGAGAGADARAGPALRARAHAGRARQEDRFWEQTLDERSPRTSARRGATVDDAGRVRRPKRQWSQGETSGTPSAIRSTLHMLGAPARGVKRAVQRPSAGCRTRSSSARGRTGWRRRSRSPAQAARCACSRRSETIGGGVAHGGADAARLRARRLLGGAPARARLAVPARAAAGRARARAGPPRRCRSRTRSTTARAVVLERSLDATARAIGGADARATGG